MTTDISEQNREKIINRQLMTKLAICKMCYLEEYTCAFKEYYYKAKYNFDEAKEIRKPYYTKLPEPFSTNLIKDWNNEGMVDTLGSRIKFLNQWFILNAITTLSTKVDSMGKELQNLKANSQQHDSKNAELRRSADGKKPELEGDVGKLHKTHDNVCLNAATDEYFTESRQGIPLITGRFDPLEQLNEFSRSF